MNEYLQLLGTQQKDRVTGFRGFVASISFDAYGCVQAYVTPAEKDGKLPDGHWFDVKRLLSAGKRVMPVPVFAGANREPGGIDKPAPPGV